jgi:hypothetical protein
VPAEKLWSLFEQQVHAHVRRNVLVLVSGLRWWDGAPYLIAATGSDDATTRKLATNHIARWGSHAGRLTARPSHSEIKRLEEAVARYGPGLEDRVRRDLESLLSQAKRTWS